jgi:hypothetical protein
MVGRGVAVKRLDDWRYDVEAIIDDEWLRVVVELPDETANVVVVTVVVLQ